MDNRVIVNDKHLEELRFWQHALLLNTSIPAIVDEFDLGTQRVSATPAIKARYIDPDLTIKYVDYPKITNIPLAIQSGNGISITYPIKKGDLCTLIFSQRSIDNLLLDGTKTAEPFVGSDSPTTYLRCMDLTDAMCFPGIITNSNPIDSYNNDAVEIRNSDASVKITVAQNGLTLKQDGATLKLNGGDVEIEATNIKLTGTTVMINNKNFDTHVHSGVESGTSNTGIVVA